MLSFLLAVSGVQEQTVCCINLKLGSLSNEEDIALGHVVGPVSYTHLTLPTIYSV